MIEHLSFAPQDLTHFSHFVSRDIIL